MVMTCGENDDRDDDDDGDDDNHDGNGAVDDDDDDDDNDDDDGVDGVMVMMTTTTTMLKRLTGTEADVGRETVVSISGGECGLQVAETCRRIKDGEATVLAPSAPYQAVQSRPRWRHGPV